MPYNKNIECYSNNTRTPLNNKLIPFVIKAVNNHFSKVLNIETLKESLNHDFLTIGFIDESRPHALLTIKYIHSFSTYSTDQILKSIH